MNFAIVPENKKIFKKDLRERFIKMLDDGLIEETKFLIDKFSKNIKILSSVGYKQVLEYLENKISEEEMIEKATNANYQLSKRQITWLKKFELKLTTKDDNEEITSMKLRAHRDELISLEKEFVNCNGYFVADFVTYYY